MPPLPPLHETRAADILTDAQILAVGKVAVEWGMLEFALYAHGQAITRIFSGMTFGILTGKPAGTALATILHDTLSTFLGDHPVVPELKTVLKRVKKAGEARNEVVHGVWQITPAVMGTMAPSPKSDSALNVIIKQRGTNFQQEIWTTDELHALAEEIAVIRLDLNRLIHPLPFPVGRGEAMAPAPAYGFFGPSKLNAPSSQ